MGTAKLRAGIVMRRYGQLAYLCLTLSVAAAAQTGSPGSVTCAQCHVEAQSQPSTSMGHALEMVANSKVLIDHPLLRVTVGKYSYQIERKGSQSEYSVTDGVKTVTMPIRWAMGSDLAIGQTYILERDGELYESRVSWFRELQGLGQTLGSVGTAPSSLNDAAGRLLRIDDKLRCFGCHATNAVSGRKLTLDKLLPGVQCQHCHESTDLHLASILHQSSSPLVVPPSLPKLIGSSAEQTSNFCGQCHRTWEEIALQNNPGIANVRFQPYRLANSKCYDPDDKRIGCLACHDPHQQIVTRSTDYDSKCQACHGGGKPSAKACPVSKSGCVACHMPRLELPGAHFKFTDHWIRIVKPNEPYPG